MWYLCTFSKIISCFNACIMSIFAKKKSKWHINFPSKRYFKFKLKGLRMNSILFYPAGTSLFSTETNPDCHKSEWFHTHFKRWRFYFSLLQFGDYPDKGASYKIILIIGSLPRYLFAHQWWIQPPHWRVQEHGRTWNTSQPLHPGVKNYKNSYFKSSLIIDLKHQLIHPYY